MNTHTPLSTHTHTHTRDESVILGGREGTSRHSFCSLYGHHAVWPAEVEVGEVKGRLYDAFKLLPLIEACSSR